MASGTLPPPVAPPRAPRGGKRAALPSDFIDEQISKTRAYVKNVDIAHAVLLFVSAVVAYLLVMALVDHWLIPGGLGGIGRTLAFLVMVGGAAWHVVRTIWPLVMQRINPLYAAHTIEQCQPTFKNSLLSVLQLREQRGVVPEAVFNSVESHAATRLAEVPVESTVDRSSLVRIGYIMLGVVIAAALYYAASPKDALQSAGRVLMPWSDIAAPTRVSIADVQPGEATAIRGQQLEVSAEVTGLRADEAARIVFTTDDGQIVDREVPMRQPEGGYRHVAMLPPGDERFQGSLTYRIEAGDAISPEFRITVEPTPMIEVVAVEYDYPAYTAPIYEDRTDESSGDVRAVEGTVVTIRCRANQPIARAVIDFNCDGKANENMSVRGDQAVGKFVLSFADRANLTPKFARYQIKFYNRQGRENPTPVQHTIDVLPDLPPEVSVERPAEPVIEVPEDETVEFRATARDADFKLSEVLFRHEGRAGQNAPDSLPLLAAEKAPWQGKFDTQWRKTPRELGYRAGDVIRYWVEAVDNKTPIDTANRASTRPATIRVLAPLRPEQKPNDANNDEQKSDEQNPDKTDQPKKPDDKPQEKNPNDQNADDMNPQEQNPEEKGNDQEGKNDKQPDKQPKPDDKNEGKNDKGDKGKGEQGGMNNKGDKPKDQEEGKNDSGTPGEQAADKPSDKPGEKPNDQPGGAQGGGEKNESGSGKGETGANEPGGENSSKPGGADDPSNNTPKRKTPAGDSEAIRELIKDRQQHEGDQGGDPSEGTNSAEGTPKEKPSTDQAPSAKPDAAQPKPSDKPGEGSEKKETKPEDPMGAGGPQEDDNPQGAGTPKDEQKPNENNMGEGMGDQSKEGQQDKNAKPGGNATPEASKEKPNDKNTDGKSPGPGKGDPSSSGTGRSSKSETGSPPGQDKNEADVKDSSKENVADKPSEEGPKSPGIDKKSSDNPTEGKEAGDRGGKSGKPGGGNNSKAPGEDSAGSSKSSETGKGASQERGPGEKGDNAGEDVEADGQTGRSKEKPGNGSAGKAKEPTDKPQTNDGKPGDGKSPPSADNPQENPESSGGPGDKPGSGKVNHGGGQTAGDSQGKSGPVAPGVEREDPADLDYAKKATDLALDHLRDRMKQGNDQELLDKLGWTREDAEKFLSNWDQIKREAGNQGAGAEQRLHEELKSLGLRRGSAQFTEGQATKDQQRNLDTGVNVPTPAEFKDRQRAYRSGTGNRGTSPAAK